MNIRSQQLAEQIHLLEIEIAKLPSGNFYCCQNRHHYYKWYQISDGHHIYIPKKERKLAESLATKKYLLYLRNDLINEKKAIDSYLKKHHEHTAPKLLTDNPEYRSLLHSKFSITNSELTEWMYTPYSSNPKNPEHLIHPTMSGIFVRSKSEAIISNALYSARIPFRYENPLLFDTMTLYPDFTIRHPKTGQFYYWEHFGLMDDDAYAQNCFFKLQTYQRHKIIPQVQLITTYETKQTPLDSSLVCLLIQHYFQNNIIPEVAATMPSRILPGSSSSG